MRFVDTRPKSLGFPGHWRGRPRRPTLLQGTSVGLSLCNKFSFEPSACPSSCPLQPPPPQSHHPHGRLRGHLRALQRSLLAANTEPWLARVNMASPSITLNRILAAAPATTRGQPTQLSTDSKGQRIAYAVRPHTKILSVRPFKFHETLTSRHSLANPSSSAQLKILPIVKSSPATRLPRPSHVSLLVGSK